MTKTSPIASELSPKYTLVGFLFIRPMYGYELHKNLVTDLHEIWRISQSQTYNTLKILEKDGWITSTRQEQDKRPDRELLTLTDLGITHFEAWLFTPTPSSARAIRVEFITRLYFASKLGGDHFSQLIKEQADTIRANIKELKKRSRDIPAESVFNRMGLDLRIRQLSSALAWVETADKFFYEEVKK